ncbi:MAG: hypothetical protein Ct9H300mP3_00760 [Gammaproteobacteria bacterium]|nr:MAG: hypothetical protein Ct9H300mP3_00760 [Gammaproteobacteria bacterium]
MGLSEIWCWEKKETPAYLIKREEALDIWSQESKIEINKDSLFWWELFACVKGLAIWISAGHEFSTGIIQTQLIFSQPGYQEISF